jgi:BirA family biotin operon repressor/biotin-[acetyl-CoA-carboxylase] ligase
MVTSFSPPNEKTIRSQLSPAASAGLRRLTLVDQATSTNEVLLKLPAGEAHAHALMADYQTAGRGRRGKQWQSPPGRNIYLSLAWRYAGLPAGFSCLSLALGVCVVRALQCQGITDLELKWPNDIQVNGRKLGGILVESVRSGDGTVRVVAGVGINVGLDANSPSAQAIDQPWTSICMLPGAVVDPGLRDRIAGSLLDQMIGCMSTYTASGFEPLREEWQGLDAFNGKPVSVSAPGRMLKGKVLGIDEQGKLLVEELTATGEKVVHHLDSGEVSVRQECK